MLTVVDNGSSDRTRENAASVGANVVVEHERGASAARNHGVRSLAADFVTFIDSDDEALPGWLDGIRTAAEDGADLVFCSAVREPGGTVLAPAPGGPLFFDMKVNFLAGTFAVRRQLLIDVGLYDTEMTYSENTELGIRLCAEVHARGLKVAHVDHIGVRINDGGGERAGFNDAGALAAAERLMEKHADHFRRDRRAYAACSAIAGVRATRLGMRDRAVQHFSRAAAIKPGAGALLRVAAAVIMFPVFTRFARARVHRVRQRR
jgi:glycosyltransferase involved in cell wall biosynthesis